MEEREGGVESDGDEEDVDVDGDEDDDVDGSKTIGGEMLGVASMLLLRDFLRALLGVAVSEVGVAGVVTAFVVDDCLCDVVDVDVC